ncbi:hypothetical protein NC661_07755 [Aquibacillus koreensis]|uniref:Uncharacterized protein n=1 Tax=Aquibacillus koreensis TaxID=279446 RepID=A0A9X4AJB4_9BACI|nr:hypothetical protein [Aquibacillus koreensis]MCT2535810.1 hypothetical protein [Aquibacillus koreensis]MDC3420265.1 hypothetical protein [Aquibacillus koreensis]
MSVCRKKALIITDLSEETNAMFLKVTNKDEEALLISNSFEVDNHLQFSAMVRDITFSIYNESIEEIYVITEKSNKYVMGDNKLEISQIQIVSDQLHADTIIRKKVDQIRKHPLIPKSMIVKGIVVNTETEEYELVS